MNNERAGFILREIFLNAVGSARAGPAIPPALPEKPKGRCVVIGAGKASAAMAAAVDAAWPDVALSGVVVTRYGHAVPAGRIRIVEAAHPVSDAMSETAAMLIVEAVKGLSEDDLVLALISGGGSALMALPAPGLTLADKQVVTRALLHSGATIGEMNLVRRHLSAIKGGKLAALAQPARVVSLIISDVPGDRASDIASGPTVADESTPAEALSILERYRIPVSRTIYQALMKPAPPRVRTSPDDVRLIATPAMALDAAALLARQYGLTPMILGDALEGESRDMGIFMAGMARSVRQHGQPLKGPALLLSGGETTVTLTHGKAGRGGRNTEFLLSLACALKGEENVWAIAGDSDGIDGTEDAAGAIVYPDTLTRGRQNGLSHQQSLDAHDSYSYFQALDDLIVTGPTLTNVNDIRAVLIL
ncbi:glycerate kinase type-2 family protein [Pantoea sp. FN060301]|uniref:glycerate kinase type-2 family protein n=1 Tax=Pantoea sp. FN060301 TaxID=3420380 RepID=UPI003D17E802